MFLGSTGTGAVPSSRPAPHGPSRAAEVKDGRRPPRSGLSLTEASTMAPSRARHSVAKRKRQLLTRPLRLYRPETSRTLVRPFWPYRSLRDAVGRILGDRTA